MSYNCIIVSLKEMNNTVCISYSGAKSMYAVRQSSERGVANFGWLDSRHTFSFGHYHDPEHMGFEPLRVINEDRVKPGRGFDTHGHRDMEIISYVISGALLHEDSMGNGSVIRPGDVQRMSAGTGVRHSEYNASGAEDVHFLQIWIQPEQQGLTPGYEQKMFDAADKRNRLRLVGSRTGRDGSVSIHQDVDLYASLLAPGVSLAHRFDAGRKGWLQVVQGAVEANGLALEAGDGLSVQCTEELHLIATSAADVLLFDMR
jgi:redox-sensitive bicupin YhaK (pirin superfamily)